MRLQASAAQERSVGIAGNEEGSHPRIFTRDLLHQLHSGAPGHHHISDDEIDRALRESNGRLTILVFTGADNPEGLLDDWLRDPVMKERVRIHTNRGFFHADNHVESQSELPWWKFEVLARLLRGDR